MLKSVLLINFAAQLILAQTQPKNRPPECATANVTEQDVANQVFALYGNWQRPVRNVSQAVNVNITFALSSINDVIEKQRYIQVSGYLSIRWFDELRVWNTTFPLNCITYVVVPSTTVWLPDIAQMNAEERYTLMNLEGEKVRIYSDGYTIYSPGGTFAVFCEFDLTLFPFDEQMCPVKFESWRITHQFMTFNFGAPNIKIYQWMENQQWALTNISQRLFGVSYFDPENSFDRVEFYVSIKRKSRYYMLSVIIPGTIISVSQFAIFALPLEEIQKISILFTCLLAYLVFMLMIIGDMPRSSDNVPLLSVYIEISMALISISILGECLVFILLRKSRTRHPEGPGFVPKLLENVVLTVAKFLHISSYYPHQSSASPANAKIEAHPSKTVAFFSSKDSKRHRESTSVFRALSPNFDNYELMNPSPLIASQDAVDVQLQDDDFMLADGFGTDMLVTETNYLSPQPVVFDIPPANNGTISALDRPDPYDATRPQFHLQEQRRRNRRRDIKIARIQWHFVAHVADRVTLILYSIGVFIVPVVLFVIMPNAKL